MFKFLGILLFMGVIVLLTGFAILLGMLRNFFRPQDGYFNGRKSMRKKAAKSAYERRRSQDYAETEEGDIRINRKKFFTKDDGEYVDYEEVKD